MSNSRCKSAKKAFSRPLGQELKTIAHILLHQPTKVKTGLCAGFRNPFVTFEFCQNHSYWAIVESSPANVKSMTGILDESTVFSLLSDGTFPFEDRQFDCAILSSDFLHIDADTTKMIRECHRIIKTGGLLIFTVERKNRSLRASPDQRIPKITSEKDVFRWLKNGFDVLGIHYSCRFWTNLVRSLPSKRIRRNGEVGTFKSGLYAIAAVLDSLLFFSRGRRMTVHARRKSWREQNNRIIGHATGVSNAILFNTKNGPEPFVSRRIN